MKLKSTLLAMLLAPTLVTTNAQAALTPEQKQEIEQLVADYLEQNPEVVIKAIQAWREQQKAAEAALLKQTIGELRQEVAHGKSPEWGNPQGKTVIVEFSDYNCPYCKRVFPEVERLVEKDGDIRIVMKELPVLGPGSEYAAKAALAARKQGKYQAFHKQMMTGNARVSRDGVDAMARQAGLDLERMKRDMESPEIEQELQHNQLWAERLGISGTPAFVIGDKVIPGAIDGKTMKRLVEAARAAKRQ
jgi:protein-disulfide isomerase